MTRAELDAIAARNDDLYRFINLTGSRNTRGVSVAFDIRALYDEVERLSADLAARNAEVAALRADVERMRGTRLCLHAHTTPDGVELERLQRFEMSFIEIERLRGEDGTIGAVRAEENARRGN